MARLPTLLGHLEAGEARSLVVRSGEPPRMEGARGLEAVGSEMSTDDVVQILFEAGGSRYLETLGATPVAWTTRVPNIGPVKVVAKKRGDAIEAELTPATPLFDTKKSHSKRPKPMPSARPPERRIERHDVTTDRPKHRERDEEAPRSQRPAARAATRRPSSHRAESAGRETAKMKAVRIEDEPKTELRRSKPPAAHVERHVERARHTPPPTEQKAARAISLPVQAAAPAVAPEAPFVPSRELSELLHAARKNGASDLHIIAGRPAHYRLGGELGPYGDPIPADSVAKLVEPSVPRRLRAQLERNGSCDFALDLPRLGRFRVNVARQRTGLKACFRVIPAEVPTVVSLGLPQQDLEKAMQQHQGLIVVTGPSGHGKTSTLAAMVDFLNETTSSHVITVEDPIEHVHRRKRALISQREVGTHTRTFGTALKASLREDPDVIVIGELRDTETVRTALSASETGHLVIGTMNTPSAARTIERLIDLFPPGDQAQVRTTLAGGLKLVVSQRLVPSPDRLKRYAALEILPGNIALWTLIREDKTFQISSLMQRGKSAGITRLDDALADLVRAEKVALADAQRFAESPERLPERVLHGGGLVERSGPQTTPSAGAAAPKEPPPPARESSSEDESPKGIFERAGALFRKKP